MLRFREAFRKNGWRAEATFHFNIHKEFDLEIKCFHGQSRKCGSMIIMSVLLLSLSTV